MPEIELTSSLSHGAPFPTLYGMVLAMLSDLSLIPYLPYLPYFIMIAYVYFFPTFYAYVKGHEDWKVLAFTNFMWGWTVGLWFATLVWALDIKD